MTLERLHNAEAVQRCEFTEKGGVGLAERKDVCAADGSWLDEFR